jgi:uncharacterized membrane protein (UPF0127 family)
MPRIRAAAVAGCLAAAVLAGAPAGLLVASSAARAAPVESLEIASRNGVHVFQVEIVKTEEGRERGLMYRKTLPEGTGMLFDFKTAQQVSFWMRNTLVPLDMLFIRADGSIATIHANAKPLDETPIPSQAPVRYVLEIIGGSASSMGIAVGDKVTLPPSVK